MLYLRGADEEPADSDLSAACALVMEVRRGRPDGLWPRLRYFVRGRLAQARGVPAWAAESGAGPFADRVRDVARRWRPDVVHFEFFAMGQFASALPARAPLRILTPYEPYSAAASERLAASRGWARLRAALDLARWRRYERRAIRGMDAIVAFSAQDVRSLTAIASGIPVVPIPLHVPVPPQPLDPIGATPAEVLFVGNFAHPPNGDAALRLVRAIAPRVWRRAADVRVVIVGPEPPEELRAAADARVVVTGRVDDVTPYLNRAAVVVAPLRLGGGMRVKVLEALAAGKAVVASPRAVEGLDVDHGEQVMIAEHDDDFADAVADLIGSPARRAALAARAREWATASFSSERRADAYDALYRAVDARRRQAPGRDEPRSRQLLGGADVLRAADWRFLLPRPASGRFDRLVVLGADPPVLRALVAMDIAHEVIGELPSDRTASDVVVLPGCGVAPEALAAALRPGGSLYVEVDRRDATTASWTPARLRDALRAAGIVPHHGYLVERDGHFARRYLPLEPAGPSLWYLRHANRPFTARQSLAAVVKAAMLRGGMGGRVLQTMLRRFAMTGLAGDGPWLPSVLDAARAAGVVAHDASCALFCEGGDRVVALPFASGATEPAVVLKLPRNPALRARTENEQARMGALRAALTPDLSRAIPQPRGEPDVASLYVAAEAAMPGRTLLASSGRWGASARRRLADLRLAAEWISDFHLATIVERRRWGARELEEWVAAMFTRYFAAYGESYHERRLEAVALAYGETLAGVAVPVVWQHRDYAVWNLASTGHRLAVLDWEGARIGPPLCDLLHLVTTWHMIVHGATGADAELDSVRALFLQPVGADRYASAAREAIARYMERVELARPLLPMLVVHHRLELAVRRADQIADQGAQVGDPREANVWVAAVSLLAERADRLFATGR